MNIHVDPQNPEFTPLAPEKFKDPKVTAKGETRAWVDFTGLKTLWIQTGSLCNIECANCYIESSPTADHFVYFRASELEPYLDELDTLGLKEMEIGFTGGEPFMNPDMIKMARMSLERGHSVLILTNAMKPMMRPRVKAGLLALLDDFGPRMTLRVSLDHFSREGHDTERGEGSYDIALNGLDWLAETGFVMAIAGRSAFAESEVAGRAGYGALIADRGWPIDPMDPMQLVLFPEMDERVDVPEITTACWDILSVDPDSMMCANSRMVVKRKGEKQPAVLACTLLWDDPQFEMGKTFTDAQKPVQLNHPHCAKFCVLGGASCSA